ncbi:TetR/AcrR family transcriptional regulator [Haladaptatus salinisoli]|uniref:TetR/AcrR family transcriptional regulator n=1 Tax=Haladaptatus salinisoli TaxID=2884876 RepID=UPI001D0AB409|nr:TetR/AcrR family transcriptional regulator [Haladaptatus salinisoli]
MPEPGDSFWDEFETEEMIMEATVWVLAEEGYQNLTLRKVAERAGKNRGLVHYYFESKDDLLRSLLDHILEGMQRLIGIDEEDGPLEQLWTALNFFAYGPNGVDEHGRHYYLAINQLQALAAYDAELRRQFTRNHRYRIDLLADIIEEGIRNETFRPVDPEATATFLIAAVDGAQNADLSLDVDTARETTLEIIDQVFRKSIVR